MSPAESLHESPPGKTSEGLLSTTSSVLAAACLSPHPGSLWPCMEFSQLRHGATCLAPDVPLNATAARASPRGPRRGPLALPEPSHAHHSFAASLCWPSPVPPSQGVPLLVRTSPPFAVCNQERNQFLSVTLGIKMPSKLEELTNQGPVESLQFGASPCSLLCPEALPASPRTRPAGVPDGRADLQDLTCERPKNLVSVHLIKNNTFRTINQFSRSSTGI